jgi:hypothetical protein
MQLGSLTQKLIPPNAGTDIYDLIFISSYSSPIPSLKKRRVNPEKKGQAWFDRLTMTHGCHPELVEG